MIVITKLKNSSDKSNNINVTENIDRKMSDEIDEHGEIFKSLNLGLTWDRFFVDRANDQEIKPPPDFHQTISTCISLYISLSSTSLSKNPGRSDLVLMSNALL